MTSHLDALVLDASDPAALARFWGGLLGWAATADGSAVVLEPAGSGGVPLRFEPTAEARSVPDRLHLHLTSAADGDQDATVARALALGARHLDVGQLPEETHVVLADPEGNALCVIEAGNGFLAQSGFLGEVTCEGTREVGLFWSAALGWPLVWDQDGETSVRAGAGGTNISWGGPPVTPKVGRNRQHLDLAPVDGQEAEVERLLALGATRLDVAATRPGGVVLADPDGNELTVLAG